MKHLFILISMTLTANVFAQELDWQDFSKIKTSDLSVRDGKFSSFKVSNINKFIYSVNITGSKVSLQTQPPAELQTLFRLPKIDPASTDAKIKKELNSTELLKTELAGLKINLAGAVATEEETANQKVLDDFSAKYDEFIRLIQSLNSTVFELKIARVKLINFAQLDISFQDMQNKVTPIAINDPTDDLKNLILFFNDLSALKKSLDDSGIESETISTSYSKSESMYKIVNEDQILILFEETQNLREQLLIKKNFEAVAPPVQADGDFINYSVVVTPVSTTKTIGQRSPMSFNFDIPVKSGLKVDFSVGPTFAFGNGSKDEKYFLEDSPNGSGKVILRDRKNENFLNPGIAAMMHMYSRSGKNTSWGGMFGVGAGFQSIDDPGVTFYGGLSMIKGKSEKIMVSLGLSVTGVERLKGKLYDVGKEYESTNIAIGDVTEKVFKGSLFLSVSYCLTNRVNGN